VKTGAKANVKHLLMLNLLFPDHNKTCLSLEMHSTKCCTSWRE